MRFVPADDPTDSAAVREIDLQRKYHISAFELAEMVGLSRPRATALRRHLGIDEDNSCLHVFTFGSQKHARYSDNAYRRMKQPLEEGIDMDEVWRTHGPRPRRRSTARS